MNARIVCWVVVLAGCLRLGQLSAQAQTASPQEYRSTADQRTVLKSDLASVPGKEGTVLRFELPAGWVGGWHYHTGDVFVYVVSGEFVVDVEGQGRKRFGPGEVYHEAVNTTMQARNPSTRERTTLIGFQVGGKGEPLMLVAKPPRR
ncbi:MAG TPA: cupin domain-containing protein [Vicinamibacterales bacterium]|nr:cupin domain-containing protein [Vicinamibacterales bacterium]